MLNLREKVLFIFYHCPLFTEIIRSSDARIVRKKFAPVEIVTQYHRKTFFGFCASPIGRFSSSILSSISRSHVYIWVSAAAIGLLSVSKKYFCPLRVGNVSKHPIPLLSLCNPRWPLKGPSSRVFVLAVHGECIFRLENACIRRDCARRRSSITPE